MAKKKRQNTLFDDVPLFDPLKVKLPEDERAPAAPEPGPATAEAKARRALPQAAKAESVEMPAKKAKGRRKAKSSAKAEKIGAGAKADSGEAVAGADAHSAAGPTGGGELSANGSREQPLTVSQLSQGIADVLEACLSRIWVVGEVSGLKRAASGHLYFDLKDGGALISCVMWRGDASRLRMDVEDGLEVMAQARVGYYARSGRLQLYVNQLELRGAGLLELKFRQMKERLEQEGLFDAGRKRPLPQFPTTIGVVTSETGAAIRDILHVLERRWPAVRVILAPVRVQGEGSREEIARAIRCFDAHMADVVEVLIVGRGGGSLEDLWAFNEECVARAVAECRIPIVSAVGHETDFSICDFVADVRAPTPSAAAEIVVPDRREYERKIGADLGRLHRAMDRLLDGARNNLQRLAGHRFFRYPEEIAGQWGIRVDDLQQRLRQAAMGRLSVERERLGAIERRLINQRPSRQLAVRMAALERLAGRHGALGGRLLERAGAGVERLADRLAALSPLAVLGRGYSITLHGESGRAVRRAADVEAGQELETLLGGGDRIRSVVARRTSGKINDDNKGDGHG